jgi:hypothetical protein
MRKFAAVLCASLLLVAAPALATGPTVGNGCLLFWDPVTTNVGGTPVIAPITYRAWAYQTTPPVVGVTPPTLDNLTDAQAVAGAPGLCTGLAAGKQYNVVMVAIETFAPGDVAVSALSVPFPFVPDMPGVPGNTKAK